MAAAPLASHPFEWLVTGSGAAIIRNAVSMPALLKRVGNLSTTHFCAELLTIYKFATGKANLALF